MRFCVTRPAERARAESAQPGPHAKSPAGTRVPTGLSHDSGTTGGAAAVTGG